VDHLRRLSLKTKTGLTTMIVGMATKARRVEPVLM